MRLRRSTGPQSAHLESRHERLVTGQVEFQALAD